METLWYAILAAMLTAYVVLDGFDFGAGVLHLLVARTDDERRRILGAIGPLWDGNEVWLIASGGVFIFAFPRAYAAAFSGLYLALMIVLWLLVLRGVAIEFRGHSQHPLWRAAWDATFAGASALLALVFGVALGNVVRGVPLGPDGYFQEDLFAGLHGTPPGAIDPFTAVYGLFSLAILAAHGATFLAWKTDGDLHARCVVLGTRLWRGVLPAIGVLTVWTAWGQADFLATLQHRPWLWPLPLLALGLAWTAGRSLRQGRDLRAFLASCGSIVSLLGATAGAMYPTLLRSTLDARHSLDVHNASVPEATLRLGVLLWLPAIALAVGYFWYLFRSFRGKVEAGAYHHD